MKKFKAIVVGVALLLVGGAIGYIIGQSDSSITVLNESAITKKADAPPQPTSFKPSPKMKFSVGDILRGKDIDLDFEVVAIVERVTDDKSPFLKKATVYCNMPGYSPWIMYSDEGDFIGRNPQKAPNSLNYFTAGASLSLMTQISAAELSMGIKLDDVKIEQRIKYSQDHVMTPNTTGRTETVETNIIITSDLDEAVLKQLNDLALQSCFAREALRQETPVETRVFINGEEVK